VQLLSANVRILAIAGSPRPKSNSEILAKQALEAAGKLGAETSLYSISGKKISFCVGCRTCGEKRTICTIKDDFQAFYDEFIKSDGIIVSAPVYLMSVPSKLRAYMERLSNSVFSVYRGKAFPRLCKVVGVIVQGNRVYGGQEIVQQSLINSFVSLKCIAVAADLPRSYMGVGGHTFGDSLAGSIIKNQEALELSANLGVRVTEMARIIKAGLLQLEHDLPKEYYFGDKT
jgi:multimeric flavodoxin WrbA